MPAFGEYQSLFQLAAALSIGLLAFESLLDTPIAKKKPEFFILLLQMRKFAGENRAPNIASVKPDLETLQTQVENEVYTDFTTVAVKNRFTFNAAKLVGILCATASCFLLLFATTNYHDSQVGWETWASLGALLVPIGLTVWILRASARVRERLEQFRLSSERRFLELVDVAWGLRASEDRRQ